MSSTEKVYVLMGATGQVGGYTLKYLHEAKVNTRALVRDATKSAAVLAAGASSTVVGDITDAKSLATAFSGAEGVYVMLPPNVDPTPDFAADRAKIDNIVNGILNASPSPKRVVALSTIGAHVGDRPSLLHTGHLLEVALRTRVAPTISCVSVRPGGFFENAAWELGQARSESGIVHAHFNIDKKFAAVGVDDIGRIMAQQLLLSSLPTTGFKVVELEGPARYSPTDFGAALTTILGKPVKYINVPRDQWEAQYRAYGMKNPQFRMAMYDGMNEDVFVFEGGVNEHVIGKVSLEEGLRTLIAKQTK